MGSWQSRHRPTLPLNWRDERLTTEDAIERARSAVARQVGRSPVAKARRAYRARLDRLAAAAIVQAEVDARLADGRNWRVQGDP